MITDEIDKHDKINGILYTLSRGKSKDDVNFPVVMIGISNDIDSRAQSTLQPKHWTFIPYDEDQLVSIVSVRDEIPVATISDTIADSEAVASDHPDSGEAQAFDFADAYDDRLLTDDRDARSFAKDQGVTVVGLVGVLLATLDAGRMNETTAGEWLSTWIDAIGY